MKKDEMVAISGKKKKQAGIVDLSHPEETLILTRPAYETIMDNTSHGNFIDMGRTIIVQNINTLTHMVRDNIGVGIISNHPLSSEDDVFSVYEITPAIPFEIGVFAADFKEMTPVAKEFVNVLKDILPLA